MIVPTRRIKICARCHRPRARLAEAADWSNCPFWNCWRACSRRPERVAEGVGEGVVELEQLAAVDDQVLENVRQVNALKGLVFEVSIDGLLNPFENEGR